MISVLLGLSLLTRGQDHLDIELVSTKLAVYLSDSVSVVDRPDYMLLITGSQQKPKTVVLYPRFEPGWVDRRDRFVHSVELALMNLKKRGHPKLLVATPMPSSDALVADEVEPLTRQAARETHTPIFETAAFLTDSDGMPADGLFADGRLTTDGAWLVAGQMADALAPKVAKAKWRIVESDSEQPDEGPASNAIDGDPRTYWHSRYDPTEAKPPHYLVIDFGEPLRLTGMTYLPRQDGGSNGLAKDYEVYVSDSLTDWGAPFGAGQFGPGSSIKIVRWKTPAVGRFMKFVIKSEQTGGPYGSAAEIGILRVAMR